MIQSVGIRFTRNLNTRLIHNGKILLNSNPTSAEPASLSSDETKLTWEQFLKLRKQEKRINFVSSIFTSLVGSTTAWAYISQVEIDPTQMIYGVDPFVVMVGGMFASTALGYAFGPLVGGGVFNLKNRAILREYLDRQKTFLKHIIKNRADPSRNSFQNPVPDYYGENIGSLKEYRTWLRDCNAYRKKAQEFL